MPLRNFLRQILAGDQLSQRDARNAMDAIMKGTCEPAQIAALLTGLRMRGETGEELAGMAASMRAHVVPVSAPAGPLIDTCGTGGDGAQTINISTAAALVAAAGGAVVAKHGNRSISSKCGSADVLEAMGVPVDLDVPQVEECLRACGIGFLFAPSHHPAMRHVMPVRRALGVRTAFNLLGPMTNPAGARRQVIGVFAPQYVEVMARALAELGSKHVLVVCGEDGSGGVLDEISTCGSTLLWELRDGTLSQHELSPEALGLRRSPVSSLKGGDAAQNASALLAVLSGEPGPRGDAVAANAGAALYVAGLSESIAAGVVAAQELLATGAAMDTLRALREASV